MCRVRRYVQLFFFMWKCGSIKVEQSRLLFENKSRVQPNPLNKFWASNVGIRDPLDLACKRMCSVVYDLKSLCSCGRCWLCSAVVVEAKVRSRQPEDTCASVVALLQMQTLPAGRPGNNLLPCQASGKLSKDKMGWLGLSPERGWVVNPKANHQGYQYLW